MTVQTAGLIPTSPTSSAVVAIPGSGTRGSSRRHAKNHAANLSAYVVSNTVQKTAPDAAITVSMKKGTRLLGLALKGHTAPVVDLEFLATDVAAPVHVLGSCDQDGIVYLWFMYVEKDALGIDVRLRLLRKYSFYSLRRSTTAFYSRIRLAGTSESGTMVLVPNDGSNVRVVNFHCEPTKDPHGKPNVPVIAPPPAVKALPSPEEDDVPHAPEPPAAYVSPEAPYRQTMPPTAHPPTQVEQLGTKEDTFVDAMSTVVSPTPIPPAHDHQIVTDYEGNPRIGNIQEHRYITPLRDDDDLVEDTGDADRIEDIDDADRVEDIDDPDRVEDIDDPDRVDDIDRDDEDTDEDIEDDDDDYDDVQEREFERETEGRVVGFGGVAS